MTVSCAASGPPPSSPIANRKTARIGLPHSPRLPWLIPKCNRPEASSSDRASTVPERLDRVDPGGSSGGGLARREGGDPDRPNRNGEHQRIAGTGVEQEGANQTSRDQRSPQP